MECVQSLKSVERTLTMMNDKYAFQIDELRRKLSQDIRDQRPKRHCMCTLRRIKLFEHHKEGFEKRLEACMSKRLQLESLQVTREHVQAVKQTTKTFKRFVKEHDINKIEQLQESVSDMIDQAMEIQEALGEESPLLMGDDDLEAEFQQLLIETENSPERRASVPLIVPPPVTNTSISPPTRDTARDDTSHRVSIVG